MGFSCQPELKVKRLYETATWLWILERMPQTDGVDCLGQPRVFSNTQPWSLTTHCKKGNSSLTDTGSSLRQGLSLSSVLKWKGSPPKHSALGRTATNWHGLTEDLLMEPDPNSTSPFSCGRTFTHAVKSRFCPALKICSFLVYFYFHCFANSQQSDRQHPALLHKRQSRFILAKENNAHQVLC